jgi:hypothetical protein
VGSRASGRAGELSDWDFLVETDAIVDVSAALPELLGPLEPLAQQWDRLSEEATYYMVVLPGAVKVDLVFDRPPDLQPPWVVTASTLPLVDAHFWDWILWLGGKQLAGRDDLVASVLGGILVEHLLEPMGVERKPATLDGAIRAYLAARAVREGELGIRADTALGEAVRARLRAAGVADGR